MNYSITFLILCLSSGLLAQHTAQKAADKFAQLYEDFPTPNTYRTASGAPGHEYWQQKADYNIRLELDDKQQRIYGEETITYYNNSPDVLDYLWLQLDQNLFHPQSLRRQTEVQSIREEMNAQELSSYHKPPFEGGMNIEWVKDKKDAALPFVINNTMMRVDLPTPLAPKASYTFKIKWWYNINDGLATRARCGYEFFPADSNYMYSIAQFYPRMVQYSDAVGWQHKQYLGRGEFTLSFGDFEVSITVPADHIVAATGELQNATDVLTKEQRERLDAAKKSDKPVIIASQDEAIAREKGRAKDKKTWVFKANNVRDFAFVSSRKLIWDAQGVPMSDGRTVLAMSYYPKEGNPLWEKYSTAAVVHTLKTYSKYTFPYPYPVAISTHAAFTGMEYPMICFNFGRPREDGSYNERVKYSMIGVIIHEVGHNWFPMIVNSDERQWTWMDEGLNSFLQFLTECEFERGYPSRRGHAASIVPYMKGDKNAQVPIMTNSESLTQFGENAYGKPAVALNILRETILGRELFDHAFKVYANRWKFKHPTPADFFRTMEDASGTDLDWFWRGWFYGTEHVDISLDSVRTLYLNPLNPEKEMAVKKAKDAQYPPLQNITDIRNRTAIPKTLVEERPELVDQFTDHDPYRINENEVRRSKAIAQRLSESEQQLVAGGHYYYELHFKNVGGLIMPIIAELKYADGTSEVLRIPVEIWRHNCEKVTRVICTKKVLEEVVLDPYLETADVERGNNYFPRKANEPSRFELFMGN